MPSRRRYGKAGRKWFGRGDMHVSAKYNVVHGEDELEKPIEDERRIEISIRNVAVRIEKIKEEIERNEAEEDARAKLADSHPAEITDRDEIEKLKEGLYEARRTIAINNVANKNKAIALADVEPIVGSIKRYVFMDARNIYISALKLNEYKTDGSESLKKLQDMVRMAWKAAEEELDREMDDDEDDYNYGYNHNSDDDDDDR